MRKIFIVLATLSSLCSNALHAEESIGLVVSTDGTVTAVNQGGQSRSLARRSPLFAGDTIKVGAQAKVQIKFSDASMMSLQANTEFRVDSYKHQNQADDTFQGTLASGGLRTVTGAISKGKTNAYKVKTPVAAMGVRGTFYACDFSKASEKLSCAYFQGSGFLENANGRLDLGADSNFDYGSAGADFAPYGQLDQPPSFEEFSAIEEGGSAETDVSTLDDADELQELSDADMEDFEDFVDQEMDIDEDSIDTPDIEEAGDTQTELSQDHLDDPGVP